MKSKIKALRREQRVYYYEHKHGVVSKKKFSKYSFMASLVSSMVVMAGMGVGVNAALNYEPKQAASYQREGVSVDTPKPAEQSSEKLKSATLKAREDEQLSKQIKTKLKNVPGGQKWSVYVRDLNSDRMASINADDMINANGGLANLFTVPALEAKMPSANWNYRTGKLTVAQCVETMLNSNDQECVKAVQKNSNLKNADSVLDSHGIKKTTISGNDKKTTARETGELLFRLQNSQLLSDKARRTVFDGLYGQKQREGIPVGCTSQCLVANITNEVDGVRSDAAIVTVGGSKYIVVISSNSGSSWSQIADVAASIRLAMQP